METYLIRTFGCQMNKHDSERVAGLLRGAGPCTAVETAEDADVVVFMTCCVRENADERLRGQVASLKSVKAGRPGQLIAVGGCIGQRDGETLLRAAPAHRRRLRHAQHRAPSGAARRPRSVSVDLRSRCSTESTDFASDLPTEREHPWHAWVPITVGCDNFCTYCIVPYVRGRERSPTARGHRREVERLVADGVLEVTLLGQNVNSYGRDLYGEPRFAEVLRAVAAHGRRAHPLRHEPPQGPLGRDDRGHGRGRRRSCRTCTCRCSPARTAILERDEPRTTRRRATSRSSSGSTPRCPDLALSTDVIVGFPGETEEDFEDTLRRRASRRASTRRSPSSTRRARARRPRRMDGRGAARGRRRSASTGSSRSCSARRSRTAPRYVGTVQPVLVEGVSKRDERVLAGRTPSNKVVHVRVPDGPPADEYAGRILDVDDRRGADVVPLGHARGYEPLGARRGAAPGRRRRLDRLPRGETRHDRRRPSASSRRIRRSWSPRSVVPRPTSPRPRLDALDAARDALEPLRPRHGRPHVAARAGGRRRVRWSTAAPSFAGTLGAVRRSRTPLRVARRPGARARAPRRARDAQGIDAMRRTRRLRGSSRAGSTTAPSCRCPSSTRGQRRRLVVLSLSYLPLRDAPRARARPFATAADRLGRRVAFVASGDCSHRLTPDAPAGYSPRGAEFDAGYVRPLRSGDLERAGRSRRGARSRRRGSAACARSSRSAASPAMTPCRRACSRTRARGASAT